MIGALIGDMIGSPYEWGCPKTTEFPLFKIYSNYTDDSVMSIATAHSLLRGYPYDKIYRAYGRKYPKAGYGSAFNQWIFSDTMEPYNSFGNGSAMRVSPVGYAFNTIEEVLNEAKKSAEVTHNHEEGIKGAQATALAIYLARTGSSKNDIRSKIVDMFQYDMDRTCDSIRPGYMFKESCQETVPEAIISFLDSTSFESAIRLAISLGGDADTLACITGGIAQAFYGEIPKEMAQEALNLLPKRFLSIIKAFNEKFKVHTRYV